MQTPLFCLPSKQAARYTLISDNFSFTENPDHSVSNYSNIYIHDSALYCTYRV